MDHVVITIKGGESLATSSDDDQIRCPPLGRRDKEMQIKCVWLNRTL
jgi:hypothetical protein